MPISLAKAVTLVPFKAFLILTLSSSHRTTEGALLLDESYSSSAKEGIKDISLASEAALDDPASNTNMVVCALGKLNFKPL